MPWEVTIVGGLPVAPDTTEDLPPDLPVIGDMAGIIATFSAALPEARFQPKPAGLDIVRRAEADGVNFPEIVRAAMIRRPASLYAEYEHGDLYLKFSFIGPDGQAASPTGEVRTIFAEVRGAGDALAVLKRLIDRAGWLLYDDSTRQRLDLDSSAASQSWTAFQTYVRRAMTPEKDDDE